MTSKKLPPLPDSNLQDIDLNTSHIQSTSIIAISPAGPYKAVANQAQKNPIIANTHTPSPLKHQVPAVSRSSSMTSSSSSASTKTASSVQYMVSVDKTPQHMTPSQRLMLRKARLNTSIAKYKIEPPNEILKHDPKLSSIDSEDEDIDDDEYVFNVPISQSLPSLSQREKFTFGNSDRNFSISTTASTRASSIMSHGSSTDADSIFTTYDDISSSKFNIDELRLSKDAHALTLLFNQNEHIQTYEESRQRKKLLNQFTKVNLSSPSLIPSPSESPQSSPNLKTPTIRSVSAPSLNTQNHLKIQAKSFSASPPVSAVPQSSTFSKYYSFTRPTWLPPKSMYDKKKHQRESEDIICQALIKESKEQSKKSYNLARIQKLKVKDMAKWYALLDTLDYKEFRAKASKMDSAWWRGIAPELRSQIWWRHFSGTNKFNNNFCDYLFGKVNQDIIPKINEVQKLLLESNKLKTSLEQYKKPNARDMSSKSICKKLSLMETELNEKIKNALGAKVDNGLTLSSVKTLYDRITHDLLDIYPDLNFFQNYEVIQNLTKIVLCLVLYLYESAPSCQDENLLRFYFPGLNNLIAVFYYHYKNPYKALLSISQIYDNQVSSLFFNYRVLSFNQDNTIEKNIIVNSLNDCFIHKFETTFEKNLASLSTHFKVFHVSSLDFLPSLVLGLLSNLLNFQISNTIIDIYIFEKEDFVIKLIIGFFKSIQHKLYGNKHEILSFLGVDKSLSNPTKDTFKYLNVGDEHEFIELLKNIEV